MNNQRKLGILLVVSIGLLVAIPAIKSILTANAADHAFVTGKNSKYCYFNGNEDKRIKMKIYYQTLTECGKTFKK